tara:strand:- start:122 stop:379 length:258 start_codon:yes stop_codon:yes gene_type:complete
MNKKITEITGYVGMILVHSALLPTTIAHLAGWSTNLPPLSMVLILQLGLLAFLVRAIAQKDCLYIISNSFGFATQSIMLALILLK